MPSRRDPVTGKTRRGVSNGNERGSAETRRRRRVWIMESYRADRDAIIHILESGEVIVLPAGTGGMYSDTAEVFEDVPATRCYKCGILLVNMMRPDGQPGSGSLTIDRIIPGCEGGTYRRNNIRPACGRHNSETGGAMANNKTLKKVTGRRGHAQPTTLDAIEQSERITA